MRKKMENLRCWWATVACAGSSFHFDPNHLSHSLVVHSSVGCVYLLWAQTSRPVGPGTLCVSMCEVLPKLRLCLVRNSGLGRSQVRVPLKWFCVGQSFRFQHVWNAYCCSSSTVSPHVNSRLTWCVCLYVFSEETATPAGEYWHRLPVIIPTWNFHLFFFFTYHFISELVKITLKLSVQIKWGLLLLMYLPLWLRECFYLCMQPVMCQSVECWSDMPVFKCI